MQLDLTVKDGLQRRLKVRLSDRDMIDAISRQPGREGDNLNLHNILSSNDPVAAIEQQHGTEFRESVIAGVLQTTFEEASRSLQLDVAGKPLFQLNSTGKNDVLEYMAAFEIYPAISFPDMDEFQFTRLVAQVSEQDVEYAIQALRRQQANWGIVERPAENGDSVIINYSAQVGERVFEGKSMRVELNGDDMVLGFEQGLYGAVAGQKLSLPLEFPENHYQTDVAGKTVIFDVEAVRVESMILPELDTEFIRSYGIESGQEDVLRKVVQSNMEKHLQKNIRMKNSLSLLSAILEKKPVEVPRSLVDEEIVRLTCDPCEEAVGIVASKHDIDTSKFTALATNRIARSLITSRLAEVYDIELDSDEVRTRLEELVEEYTDSERVIEWFYEDRVRLAGIESDVLGEQVADRILDSTQAEIIQTSYSEVMNVSANV